MLVLFCVACSSFGLYMVVSSQKSIKKFFKEHKNCTACSTGTILRIVEHVKDGKTNYHPVYQFCANNEDHQYESRIGRNPAKYKLGDKTKIYYDPKEPFDFFDVKDSGLEQLEMLTRGGRILILAPWIFLLIKFMI